jgi:TPR repeat protein
MAAEKGYAREQYNWGLVLEEEKDFAQAAEMFKLAAHQNYAHHKYEMYLIEGKGVAQEIERGRMLLKNTADLGILDAMADYGKILFGEKETAKMIQLLRKAAGQGHVGAQYVFALCLSRGERVEKDMMKAVEMMMKAAQAGNADVHHTISIWMMTGNGIDRNLAAAAERFRIAADQGRAEALLWRGFYLQTESASSQISKGQWSPFRGQPKWESHEPHVRTHYAWGMGRR